MNIALKGSKKHESQVYSELRNPGEIPTINLLTILGSNPWTMKNFLPTKSAS